MEETRSQRKGRADDAWFDELLADFKYAGRALRRSPGFSLVVVLTLAIGIGATTLVFTVVNSVLLKPLPYYAPDRLVRLMMRVPPASGVGPAQRMPVGLNASERAQLLTSAKTLTHVAASAAVFANWVGREPRFHGARVTASTFEMLGITPLVGRVFSPDDEAPSAAPVMLLSEAAWRRYFGANTNVLGETVTLEAALGDPQRTIYTIIGVLPDTFVFPSRQTQFWTAFPPPSAGGAAGPRGPLIARMAAGVSIDATASEIIPIVRELRRGARNASDTTYELVGELDEMVSPIRRALLTLSGAVACLLLIACVNVANLLLARGVLRQREIAIRSSLGARSSDILRLAFAESLLLALLGGIGGVFLAGVGVRLFRALSTVTYRFDLGVSGRAHGIPRLETITVDSTVLLFTAVLCVVVAICFGLATAVRYALRAPVETLRGGTGGSVQGLGSIWNVRVRGMFTIVEVALAMVLLVGGALLINSFVKLSQVDPGYDASRVLTFQVSLPAENSGERDVQFAEELVERLRGVAGVEAAAYANQLPTVVLKDTARLYRSPDTQRKPEPGGADTRLVSRDYLAVMGVQIVSGRGLRESDTANAPRVMLINETLARQEFPGGNPVGQLVYVGRSPAVWEIVGIIRDVRQLALDREAEPQIFVDVRQWNEKEGAPIFPIGAYFAVRLANDSTSFAANLDLLARATEPQAVVFNVAPMEELVSTTMSLPRMYAVLLGVFSAVGLTLATIGIYGVMAYIVSQRTREIGIRLAIGAQRREVMASVLRQSLALTFGGMGIGVALAVAATRYLEGLLFGITRLDVQTYLAVSLLFTLIAALASYFPARRAIEIDPVLALRQE